MNLAPFFSSVESFGPLILRLGLAMVIFPHGAQKVLGLFGGNGFAATMGFFTQTLHLPYALALVAVLTEFFAPIALFLGFFTRLAALTLAIQFVTAAILGGHIANGFFVNWTGNQKGEGIEYHILVVTAALSLLIMGAGRWAIDGWIARNMQPEEVRQR
jgi:putative oxidoreductase